MDSKKLICVLPKLKDSSEDEVFQKFYFIINEALVEEKKTYDEQILSDALKEEIQKFQAMRQKFFDCMEGVCQIEGIIRGKDNIDPDEYFYSNLLYTHHDSCECIARQAFEYED